MKLTAYFLCALGAAFAAGCSSSDPEPYAAPAAPARDAALPLEASVADAAADAVPADSRDAADAETKCNTMPFVGVLIDEIAEATTAPAAQGGSLLDGTYVLGKVALHTGAGGAAGPTGKKDSALVVINASQVELAAEGGKRRASANFTVSGTTLTSEQYCPEANQQVVEFTATPTQLIVFMPKSSPTVDGGGMRVRVQTYDRQ